MSLTLKSSCSSSTTNKKKGNNPIQDIDIALAESNKQKDVFIQNRQKRLDDVRRKKEKYMQMATEAAKKNDQTMAATYFTMAQTLEGRKKAIAKEIVQAELISEDLADKADLARTSNFIMSAAHTQHSLSSGLSQMNIDKSAESLKNVSSHLAVVSEKVTSTLQASGTSFIRDQLTKTDEMEYQDEDLMEDNKGLNADFQLFMSEALKTTTVPTSLPGKAKDADDDDEDLPEYSRMIRQLAKETATLATFEKSSTKATNDFVFD